MGVATATALADPAGWDYVMLQDQSETAGGGCDTDDHLAPHEVCTRHPHCMILGRTLHSSHRTQLVSSSLECPHTCIVVLCSE